MEAQKLPLNNLWERHSGLTHAISDYIYEAACICLDRHFLSPQDFYFISNDFEKNAIIEWTPQNERSRNAWANKDDATRDGAYACAIAATELCLGLFTVRRAETLTGADYYVSVNNNPSDDFENYLRLEVSGTDLGEHEVQRRLKIKIKQTIAGNSNLPAIAAIVGFSVKKIIIHKVQNTL